MIVVQEPGSDDLSLGCTRCGSFGKSRKASLRRPCKGAHSTALRRQRTALCEGFCPGRPHLPLTLRRFPSLAELEELEGSGRPECRVADEMPRSSLGRVDTLRRFGVAEPEVLEAWRRRATPAPRLETASADDADVGVGEACSEWGDSDGSVG